MKIVQENVAGGLSGRLVAERIHQQSAAGGVCGTGVIAQKIKPGAIKGVLHAFPEDREIVGINADTDDLRCLRSGALFEIPVYRRSLSVAHGRNNGGQSAAGDRPQTFLQPFGYVNGIQISLRLRHGRPPRAFQRIPAVKILRLK